MSAQLFYLLFYFCFLFEISLIRQSRTLDKLVKKLERRYFEKYGYEFPLTGRVIC